MIPLSAPNIGQREKDSILECLDSGWVSSAGPYVSKFEKKFAEFVGVPHAVAVSSGTAALHLGLLGSGLSTGDEVIAPTITFIATVNAINYCGAKPIFFDCDEFFNLNLDAVQKFLEERCELRVGLLYNRSTNKRVWGMVPTHVFGNPIDMNRVTILAKRFGLTIVEDAAESVGSFVSGKHTGTFGICGCFSFNGNKIMTTGGGGMIVTESAALAEKLRYLSTQAKDDPDRFIHNEVGFNYRLISLQAALGIAQLESIQEFLASKQRIFARYTEAFKDSDHFQIISVPPYGVSNYWLSNIRLNALSPHATAESLISFLKDQKIEARRIWWPNHLQKPYAECERFEISRAELEVSRVVSIPSSSGMSKAEQEQVIAALKRWAPS